jgi:hypothetical protein
VFDTDIDVKLLLKLLLKSVQIIKMGLIISGLRMGFIFINLFKATVGIVIRIIKLDIFAQNLIFVCYKFIDNRIEIGRN